MYPHVSVCIAILTLTVTLTPTLTHFLTLTLTSTLKELFEEPPPLPPDSPYAPDPSIWRNRCPSPVLHPDLCTPTYCPQSLHPDLVARPISTVIHGDREVHGDREDELTRLRGPH